MREKMLLNIFDPIRLGDDFVIQTNKQLYELRTNSIQQLRMFLPDVMEIGEDDDHVYIGKTNRWKLYYRVVSPIGYARRGVETPGKLTENQRKHLV